MNGPSTALVMAGTNLNNYKQLGKNKDGDSVTTHMVFSSHTTIIPLKVLHQDNM